MMLLWAPLTRPRRWKAAAMVVVCGLAPSVAWSFFTSSALHGGSARQFAWHAPSAPIHWLLYIGSGWILPGSIPGPLREALLVVILLAAGLLLLLDRVQNREGSQHHGHVAVLATFAATYLAVLMFTLAFLDDTTPIDNRKLCPLIPLLYLFLIGALSIIDVRARNGSLMLAALCLIAASGAVVPTLSAVDHGIPPGNTLMTSATMRAVRRLPPDTVIATGVNTLLYTDTGRAGCAFPCGCTN